MILRPAQVGDAPGIAAVVNPVIRDTTISFRSDEKPVQEYAEGIRDSGRYFVAERDGQIIGYACYFQFRGGDGYRHTCEHSIALLPEARGLGAGRGLMAMLENHARAAGVHTLFAGVSGENPDGIAFHAAIGFRQVSVLPEVGYKFGRWIDLVLMQKFL